jgi:MFS family permease
VSDTLPPSPAIVRVLVVWAAATVARWAFTILLALYAYEQGGVVAVGVAALVRALPPAVAAPAVALWVDRTSRVRALRWSCGLRAVLMVVTAVAVTAGASVLPVLALAAGLTVAEAAHRPAQAGLLGRLARTPTELATANVAWSVLDSGGFLAGSLLVGVLVATTGPVPAFWACAALFAVALAVAGTLAADDPPVAVVTSAWSQVSGGARSIRRDPRLRVLTTMYGLDMLTQGVLDVVLVVAAIELLGLGGEGAGWLSAAWGIGGVLAGVAVRPLLRRGRPATVLLLGCLVAGLPLVAVGLLPHPVAAVALFVVLGVGSGSIEIADLTLTQRLVPADVLGRVYGVREVIDVGTTAVGGILAAGLVSLLGVNATLVALGVVLPLAALVRNRPLRALQSGIRVPEDAFALLRAMPMFAPLPVVTVETLAVRARTVHAAPGDDVITQGDPGSTFYVVVAGEVEVLVDGAWCRTIGPGDHFGEIALLRDVARTATVRALAPLTLLALDRAEFLAGIGAHALSREEAERVARLRS